MEASRPTTRRCKWPLVNVFAFLGAVSWTNCIQQIQQGLPLCRLNHVLSRLEALGVKEKCAYHLRVW